MPIPGARFFEYKCSNGHVTKIEVPERRGYQESDTVECETCSALAYLVYAGYEMPNGRKS